MAKLIPKGLKESVESAEIKLKTIMDKIVKAKAIGLDVKELTSEAETQKKQLELIKRVYEF